MSSLPAYIQWAQNWCQACGSRWLARPRITTYCFACGSIYPIMWTNHPLNTEKTPEERERAVVEKTTALVLRVYEGALRELGERDK